MTPERYHQIEELCHGASQVSTPERSAFVARACAGDEPLRREVESLLESFDRAGQFLEVPPDDLAADLLQRAQSAANGRTLGHYRIRSRLGAGGMGEVYLADDLRLGRAVALKLLPGHLTADPERRRRQALEAQAASTLSHPNVAHIYELGEAEGVQFIAMEYVPGRTLSEAVAERRLQTIEAVAIALQVADALEEAHAKGIVHRDIKPLNVMLTPRGLVKVLDFGLAKMAPRRADSTLEAPPSEPATAPGLRMGTAGYMSPEQALGLEVDARSDVFSFGAMLFQMISGQPPFVAQSDKGEGQQAAPTRPEALEQTMPDVPIQLTRILGRCLASDPGGRYPSGKELHADLRSLSASLRAGAAAAPTSNADARRSTGGGALAAATEALARLVAFTPGRRPPDASPSAPALQASPVRLAVLPFDTIGEVGGREYLADALTEETISALGRLEPERLSVLGRTSILGYRRTTKSLAEIARELGAAYLVESSIRAEGTRVRVISKLIRASDQVQVWSYSYDSEPLSMLAFQQELGATLAEQIRLRLSPDRLALLARRQTRNPQAYDLYLRGRHLWFQLTAPTTQQAIDAFSRATAIDPDYALAWSGLADAYSASPVTGDAPVARVRDLARNAALQAVRAEPELAESQASLGFVQFWLDWQWPEAEASFQEAAALDPSYAFAHRMLGLVLSHQGRYPEARQEMQRSRELEPLYSMHHALSAQVAYAGGDMQAAIQYARQAIVIDPQFWIGHLQLAHACAQSGDSSRALESALEASRLSGGNSKAVSLRGYILAKQGKVGEAREVLQRLEALARDRFVPPYAMALVHAGLGERQQALSWLERGAEVRDVHFVFLTIDPKWDWLREEPRFRELLCRFSLPKLDPFVP